MKYSFLGSRSVLDKNLVLITGVARSGTTITGQLIASLEGIDFEYEPWFFAQLPILANEQEVDSQAVSEMYRSYVNELFLCHLLGRCVNLRPSDDSQVEKCQPPEVLRYKWNCLKTREDAEKFALDRNRVFAMKAVNLEPYYEFLFKTFPKIKIVHIVRNAFDVALSIVNKGWYANEFLEKVDTISLKKKVKDEFSKKLRTIPWWVEETDVSQFINTSEFGRGLLCWRSLTERGEKSLQVLGKDFKKKYLEIRYEDLIEDPALALGKLSAYLGTSLGAKSDEILRTVHQDKRPGKQQYPLKGVSQEELDRVTALMKSKGYEIPRF